MEKDTQIGSLKVLIGVGFLAILLLSACSGSAPPEQTLEITQAPEIQETQPKQISPTEIPTATKTELPVETDEGYPSPPLEQHDLIPSPEEGYPAPEIQLPTPENSEGGYPSPKLDSPPKLKSELEATRPSSVNLTSGELQLVEFFAFW
jgi:hypothetical protein